MMSPITPSSEATNIQAFSYSRDGHASSASDMTADAPVGEGIASMVPKVVPTPATETAPAGYIVDDLTRGIIFWEVKSDGEETAIESAIDDSVIGEGSESGPLEPHRSATEPTRSFRVEWLSVNRVPFYRTRGLKNAFNDGKDVKIARDGTRIEPEVGAKLTGLFRPVGGGPAMLN